MHLLCAAAIAFPAASQLPGAAKPQWINLIDAAGLKGWRAEGKAGWKVENGVLIGRQGPGGAAGDLFSEGEWADFELEAEWTMRFPGNSGIWFRVAGPKTGYQADFIDQPSHPGVLSGSLYCMGKAFIAENRDPSTVNRDGWNKLRIRAVGDHIVIEQNGKKIVDVRDGTFRGPGRVGIQVHAGKQFEGMEVKVRHMRIRPLDSGAK